MLLIFDLSINLLFFLVVIIAPYENDRFFYIISDDIEFRRKWIEIFANNNSPRSSENLPLMRQAPFVHGALVVSVCLNTARSRLAEALGVSYQGRGLDGPGGGMYAGDG